MAGPWDKFAPATIDNASGKVVESGPWDKHAGFRATNDIAGDIAARNELVRRGVLPDDSLNPANGMSQADLVAAGVGKAGVDTARGVGQLVHAVSRDDVAAARARDTGLMNTTAGFSGNVAGNAAMLLLPGGALKLGGMALKAPAVEAAGGAILAPQTVRGAASVGGAMGLVQPSTSTSETAGNVVTGTLASAAVPAAARGYQAIKSGAVADTGNTLKDATLNAARDAGYVVPPTQANPSILNRVVEGVSGKIQTGQSASLKNQPVTNKLAREALGIPEDVPITKEVLNDIRKEAGKAYDVVRGAGIIKADPQFGADLAKITAKYEGAAKDFPELAKNEIGDIVKSINKPEFSADSAIDAISILRDKSSSAYAKGDKSVGSAFKQTAQAMEDALERHLVAAGDDAAIKTFRDARQLIAKTYSVESALNGSGNVNAQKLAGQLKKNKPLSGELKSIGEFAEQFPKAAQNVDQVGSLPGISPLDVATAAISHNPAGWAMLTGRPLLRSLQLSQPYQKGIQSLPGSDSALRLLSRSGAAAGPALPALLNAQKQ